MKKLLKNKRLRAVIGGTVALLLVISVAYVISMQDKPSVSNSSSEPSASDTGQNIVIEAPDSTASSDAADVSAGNEIADDGSGLKPDEKISDSSTDENTGEKAQGTASPAKEANPPKDSEENNNGGIQIGGGESTPKYNCGSPNHHCAGPETHAFTLNLEDEGCLYCGSHSCPSFYAVDEWGNTCYTPSKCPKYDIKKDSVEYCQACGRKNGNGDNNTCQKWIIDFTCPICGELVKANECHTH